MSVLQRVQWYADERLDTPDARALEAYGLNDWKFFSQGFLSDTDTVIAGFEISNYQNVFLVPGFAVRISDIAMFHPSATTQASGFYIASGEEPDAVVPLSASSTNYVEADFAAVGGSPDIRAFWDPSANSGAGAEFTQTVNTAVNLSVTVTSNVSGFTAGKVPLYKVTTNGSGVATSVTDCRNMFFRLGTGGSTPNPSANFAWPSLPDAAHARSEPPSTATSYSAGTVPFQGGDKNITNLHQLLRALESGLKEVKETPYWYSPPGAPTGSTFSYLNSAMTILMGGVWTALGAASAAVSATSSTLTVQPGAPFTTAGGSFTASLTPYTYASYDSDAAVFSGVSPSPAGIVAGTSVQQGAVGSLEMTGGSTVYRMGQADNASLSAFASINLTANPDLYVLLPLDGATSVTYGMGQDGATPVIPKAISSVTSSTVTVPTGGNYATGSGNLMMAGQAYAYSAYNAGTGLFTGVSPDPSSLVMPGMYAYADINGSTGYYLQGTRASMPGLLNGVSQGAQRVFWLAVWDGTSLIRTREAALEPGEVIDIGDSAIQNILQYIGSSGPSDTFPVYDSETVPDGTSLTQAIATALHELEAPVYDEDLTVVSGSPASSNQVTGPLIAGSTITIPHNSRASGTPQEFYEVGDGTLEFYLNGQRQDLGNNWLEVGASGTQSSQVQVLQSLVVGDVLEFRNGGLAGSNGGGGGSGSLQDAYDNGASIQVTPGSPVAITTSGPYVLGNKLLSVAGDVDISGVVDPLGITFTQQASDPLPPGSHGLWVDNSGNLIQKQGGTEVNITQAVASGGSSTSTPLFNNSGSTIPAFRPVSLDSSGNIVPADPTTEASAMSVVGVLPASAPNAAFQTVVLSGRMQNVTVSGGSLGQAVWVNTDGTLTTTKPSIGVGSWAAGMWIVKLGSLCANASVPTNLDLLVNVQTVAQL